MLTDNLCMGCMREIEKQEKCPHCGFLADTPQTSPYLPLRSAIGGKYLTGRVISAGGDGITYIGWDMDRETAVSIREFLPQEHIARSLGDTEVYVKEGSELVFHDGLAAFLNLWRKLARLRDLSALSPVLDILEDHGTAYAVSEYFENISLREFLLKSRTGYLLWEQARALLMPVLTTMCALHDAGIYHLGISPNTLVLGRDGKLRLTGFMIPDARLTNTDYNAELISGYAPFEQYDFNGKVGAWSDVYAFTAVIYRTLIGSMPNDANERAANDKLIIPAKFAESLPAYLVSAIHNGLQIQPEDRIRTVDELREQLSGSPSTIETNKSQIEKAAKPVTTDDELAERRRKEKLRREQAKKEEQTKTLLISFGICIAIGLVVLAAVLFFTRDQTDTPTTNPTEAVSLVSVPNFKGQSYSRISSDAVQNQRFSFEVEYAYDSTVEVGYIISQSIEEGQQIPMGSKLKLVVSKGIEYVAVPNVAGDDYIFAEANLIIAGFKVEKVEKSNDGTHTAGQIIETTPAAGSSVEKGSTIYVQVWGPVPTTAPENTTGSSFWNFF